MPELRRIKAAAEAADDGHVAQRLDWIEQAESVLAPWSYAFQYVLGSHGASVEDVAKGLGKAWGTGLGWVDLSRSAGALSVLGGVTADGSTERLSHSAVALREGDWRALLRAMLQQNAAVMDARGAGPWVSVEKDRLDVRFRGDASTLPAPDALMNALVNPYYLGALKTVGRTLTRPTIGDQSVADE